MRKTKNSCKSLSVSALGPSGQPAQA